MLTKKYHIHDQEEMVGLMKINPLVAPVVKWVGGKRQLIDELKPLLPKKVNLYCEPFFGGGALLFALQPSVAIVNDINYDLISMYETIRDNVESLLNELSKHPNEREHYYNVRDWDRNHETYDTLSSIERAARIIYLNKTCYNGLYRVNNAGEFNTPFGNYKNPNITNAPVLKAVSKYFNEADIKFYHVDYYEVTRQLPRGAFVYLDPPYDPLSSTSNFTGYTRGGFSRDEQIRLRECCDNLNERGIKFMLSNSSTNFIKEQYKDYIITPVKAKRSVNSDPNKRGDVDEVVIRNYE